MANPAKRKVTDDSSGTPADGADSSAKVTPTKVVPPKAKAKSKATQSARVTPSPRATAKHSGPSPRWVPALMFSLWGVGLLLIVLNYMEVLPGAGDGGNGWYLIAGLVSILAGIMAATQYR